jgi:hypothetical protein
MAPTFFAEIHPLNSYTSDPEEFAAEVNRVLHHNGMAKRDGAIYELFDFQLLGEGAGAIVLKFRIKGSR